LSGGVKLLSNKGHAPHFLPFYCLLGNNKSEVIILESDLFSYIVLPYGFIDSWILFLLSFHDFVFVEMRAPG
jgi:hypothetical protein